ncbi:lipopolysaccharide biosynthesis protein [Nocardioides sp. URHA0032]|uniref:lipopolysaccharide biosynthesis protein n=1 Tax=Nocardioides sp. URHA0032 TaxID=1380388 RepID=UPI000ABBA1FB|nr:oligosaccharide flippase family protein [Nocardioides sp. URHA0032]
MSRLMSNSLLVFVTTILMAGAGAVFWVIAARLASPQDVGLAGSLVAAGDSLALFAQLGLNIAIVRTLPASSRKAADVVTAALVVLTAGAAFALVYALLLPMTSPRLADVLSSPLTMALYAVLVAVTALNVLTDSVFLAIDRVWSFLRLNGVLMGVLKCGLPFLLAGAGAFGLYGSVGLAVGACGVASVLVILRHVPGSRTPRPSPQLLANRGFAAAGYVTYVLTVLPLLVFPLIVVNALGSAQAGAYFISFQVAALLNAVVLSVANLSYAEVERAQDGRHAVVRRSGLLLLGGAVLGCAAMVVLAPYFLAIFGSHYVDEGTTTLRVLALACVGAAFNYWGMLRLRLAAHLTAMIGVQVISTVVMLVLAILLAPHGTVWVGAAWGIGHAVGGLLGYLATAIFARFPDRAPDLELEPA